jgi:hypothetical protein
MLKIRKVFLFIILIFLVLPLTLAVRPYGANYTEQDTETAPLDAPQGIPAQAGNVTELNIFGYSTTQSWQGYFGNVTGTIHLADSDDNIMYNWSLASPEGEIYASTNESLEWSNVQCFNFTATGTYLDDTAQAGATSLYGKNLSQLEEEFGIEWDDVDGVNETFIYGPNEADTHNLFYTANLEFSNGECQSTRIFSNAGKGENNKFEEVLLYDPSTRSTIFTSLLNEDLLGFDSATHDFEMLVLEDGHETDTDVTNYYFYVELE